MVTGVVAALAAVVRSNLGTTFQASLKLFFALKSLQVNFFLALFLLILLRYALLPLCTSLLLGGLGLSLFGCLRGITTFGSHKLPVLGRLLRLNLLLEQVGMLVRPRFGFIPIFTKFSSLLGEPKVELANRGSIFGRLGYLVHELDVICSQVRIVKIIANPSRCTCLWWCHPALRNCLNRRNLRRILA